MVLPTRVALNDQEALDGFLERLAAANDVEPRRLLGLLSEHGRPGATACLIVRPDSVVVSRISELSGISASSVRLATLARYDGDLPLCLNGFDPGQRESCRRVVAQGWFPPRSSQVCPRCIALDGIWRLQWRLPIITVCLNHQVFLISRCAGCGRAFRDNPRSPVRSIIGPSQPCGNNTGSDSPCRHSVIDHWTEVAAAPILHTTRAILDAMASRPVQMFGHQTDPRVYLAELRQLATLLVHLSARPEHLASAPWEHELHREARQRRTGVYGPLWNVRPPRSAVVRGHALTEAHHILSQPSFDDATAAVLPWFDPISGIPGGPRSWLTKRTRSTPVMRRIINVAIADRSDLGPRLSATRNSYTLRPQSIPQLIDADIYVATFERMLGTQERTGRLYVSLCIARTVTSAATWPDAAASIGVAPDLGLRIAVSVCRHVGVTPKVFADAVDAAVRMLPTDRDFRRRESAIRSLSEDPTGWFETWRRSTSPPRRPTSGQYAITWMWCEVAQAPFDVSPAWPAGPTVDQKSQYRIFCQRLPQSAKRELRALASRHSDQLDPAPPAT